MALRQFVFLVLLLAGCATHHQPAPPTVQANFGLDSYSSISGVLSREACLNVKSEVKVALSAEQLDNIGEIADRSGFFSMPPRLERIYPDGRIEIISDMGYSQMTLDISYKGKHNRVTWDSSAPQIGELYTAVANALSPAAKRLPPSQCRRLP